MGLRVVYESGISNQTTEIGPDRLRLYTFDVTQHAEEGSVALSSITFDDPDGDLDIVGWRRMWAYEDTATGSNSLIGEFWVADRKIRRGESDRVEASRIWQTAVSDQNAVLGFRLFSFNQAERPQESDVARMQWLAGAMASFGRAPVTETEFLFGAGPVTMDAADYRGQSALDVANDCAQQSGKNFFVYTKDNGYPASQPTRGIWYGSSQHTGYSSPLRLTNVEAEADGAWTFVIARDTELTRDPSRTYSGVYGQYQGGSVYKQLASTYDVFTQRDAPVPMPNVRTAGAAQRRADRYLADFDTEDDRITTGFYCPADKINFVKQGMRIQFRATHLPQYESFVWLRVLSKSLKQVSEQDDSAYYVGLTLATDDIPSSPVVQASITTEIDATLTIGSAAFIGGPSDREQHWATQVGESTHMMVPGRQYRFVADVVNALYTETLTCSPGVPRGYSLMNAPLIAINPGAASTGLIVPPTGDWSPDACTPSSQVICNDGGITGQWQDVCGNPPYAPGAHYEGTWLTFDGPAQAADISIAGTPISGFVGFLWTVRLQLQSKA